VGTTQEQREKNSVGGGKPTGNAREKGCGEKGTDYGKWGASLKGGSDTTWRGHALLPKDLKLEHSQGHCKKGVEEK